YKAKLKQAGQKATDKAAIEEIFRDRVREQGKNFSSIKYADDISAYQKLLPRARKRIAEIIINY
ncbi:MAG: hypothetical protein ING51_09115, partial [Rhodocyclaceae bacterium]|nr:hypothetical protein [Rhodocyclaceae bacterium]